MSHLHRRSLLVAVPAALALAAAGAPVAANAAAAGTSGYVMRLSSTSATVAAGGQTRTVVSFRSEPYLRGTRVSLGVSGLPDGATATFRPATPRIDGCSVLTISTASSTPAGATALTVTAITLSSDPIGTSATFSLTVGG
jgi:hypothetical protein